MIDWTNPAPPSLRTIAAICRCSSPAEHGRREADAARLRADYEVGQAKKEAAAAASAIAKREAELAARTPRADQYEVQRVEQVGEHMVLEVLYPNCAACSYEGRKVLVLLNAAPIDAMRWRRIDPHFRDKPAAATEAPSPAARFPASPEGWKDALAYAASKLRTRPR